MVALSPMAQRKVVSFPFKFLVKTDCRRASLEDIVKCRLNKSNSILFLALVRFLLCGIPVVSHTNAIWL